MGKAISIIIKLDSDLLQEIIEGNRKECLDIIREFPSTIIDAIKDGMPYPKGKWVKCKDGYTRCDQCGSRGSAIKARFCHHCGADMRGNENDC